MDKNDGHGTKCGNLILIRKPRQSIYFLHKDDYHTIIVSMLTIKVGFDSAIVRVRKGRKDKFIKFGILDDVQNELLPAGITTYIGDGRFSLRFPDEIKIYRSEVYRRILEAGGFEK